MSIEQYPAVLESMRQAPFNLDDSGIAWVESTLAGLSTKDKVGQLFCGIATNFSEEALDATLSVCTPGGVMYRPCSVEEAVTYSNLLREKVAIPMLVAANLEKGASGIVHEGTFLGSPLSIAATDEVSMATKLGEVCGSEGAAVGANWAFAPIIDIDYNFRNPITNIRTFGSDPERVRDMGVAYVEAVQAHGVAASIKHFPGDGCDERDQHLVTSINDKSVEEWDATYGAAYKASIDAGAMTVMVGHIMQPAYSRALRPELADEDMLPATLSPELMGDLLRCVANLSTKSNQTSVRIEGAQPRGANCRHDLASIPTVFVSIENPYHLIDIPRVKTCINTYNSNDNVLDAVVEKLLGRSTFKGQSPVDAFCGKWETRCLLYTSDAAD